MKLYFTDYKGGSYRELTLEEARKLEIEESKRNLNNENPVENPVEEVE